MREATQVIDTKTISQKTLDDMALNITMQIKTTQQPKKKDVKCWQYYNEFENGQDLDYLRKFGDNVLPTKPRYIGIQRPKLNRMASVQKTRPFVFSTFLTDEMSKKKKLDDKVEFYFKQVQAKLKEQKYVTEDALMNLQLQQQTIQQKVQMMQQALEQTQDPQQKMQLQIQLQDLQVLMPRIESQFQRATNDLSEQQVFDNEEIENMQRYLKYDLKDYKEELGQKILSGFRRILQIDNKSVEAWIDKTVTGKEYILVDYREGDKWPTFEVINDLKVYYPMDSNIRWTHEGRWVSIEEEYSYEQIIKNWGDKLSKTQKEELESKKSINNNNNQFISGGGNVAVDNPFAENPYSGSSTTTGNGIIVRKIWYRIERPLYLKKSPNKYTGDYYRKFVTSENLKKDPIQPVKGEKLETGYVDYVYYAVVIDDNMVVQNEEKSYQYRHPDNPSFTPLPIVGPTFNSLTDRPYSLIWATRHLQDLYNVMTHQEELLIALAGVKGQVIDLSQKPRGMSKEEQAYYRKLGRMYIETCGVDGRPKQITYNQWKDYDDSLSPSIQLIANMKESINLACYHTMGITPQSMGVIQPQDLVGTTQIAKDQSDITTAILYAEHDEVMRRAMEMLINIAADECFDEQQIVSILDRKLGMEDVVVPKGIFKGIAMELGLINSIQDEQNLKELKMFSIKQNDKGMLPFTDLVTLYSVESVKEMESRLMSMSKRAEKLQQMSSSNAQQSQLQYEKELIKFAKEYEMQMQNSKNELEGMKIKLEEAKLQLLQASTAQNQQLAQTKLATDRDTKLQTAGMEREVEMAYLNEQKRNANVYEQLDSLKLQMDAISSSINAALQNKDIDFYKDLEEKKIKATKKERNTI